MLTLTCRASPVISQSCFWMTTKDLRYVMKLYGALDFSKSTNIALRGSLWLNACYTNGNKYVRLNVKNGNWVWEKSPRFWNMDYWQVRSWKQQIVGKTRDWFLDLQYLLGKEERGKKGERGREREGKQNSYLENIKAFRFGGLLFLRAPKASQRAPCSRAGTGVWGGGAGQE